MCVCVRVALQGVHMNEYSTRPQVSISNSFRRIHQIVHFTTFLTEHAQRAPAEHPESVS